MDHGRTEVGSRVRTTTGEPGRVIRIEGGIAYVQLDDKPTPDGIPFDLADLQLIHHDG